MHHSNKKPLFKAIVVVVLTAFVFTSVLPPQLGYAQIAPLLNLPLPGTMVMPSAGFVPTRLMGMTVHPENPLQFDFIVDSGNSGLDSEGIKAESERLVKYFLAALTVPKSDLWVNLSPHEHDSMVSDYLGKTILGRDMLAQDYYLKQLTASLIHPDTELGEKFWRRVKKLTFERFGTTDIPMETFNKVWVLPEAAQVYEYQNTVYITHARLKVMTDADYTATKQNDVGANGRSPLKENLETEILREIIIPEIEREVNEGANFAPLRQIYYSLILAKWYKETIKDSLLSQIYIDKNKVEGVNVDDESIKEQIYAQYIEAYKKGVFSFIKEDYDTLSKDLIPRKYFSGGLNFKGDTQIKRDFAMVNDDAVGDRYVVQMKVTPQGEGLTDAAMANISNDTVRDRINAKITRVLGYVPEGLTEDIERAIPVVRRWLEAGDGVHILQEGLVRTDRSRKLIDAQYLIEHENVVLGRGKMGIVLQRSAGLDGAMLAGREGITIVVSEYLSGFSFIKEGQGLDKEDSFAAIGLNASQFKSMKEAFEINYGLAKGSIGGNVNKTVQEFIDRVFELTQSKILGKQQLRLIEDDLDNIDQDILLSYHGQLLESLVILTAMQREGTLSSSYDELLDEHMRIKGLLEENLDMAMNADRLTARFWDNDTKQQVVDEIGRLDANKLMILYFRLADVQRSESIYAAAADDLMKIVLDRLRAKGLDEDSIMSIVIKANAVDEAMLVRTPQGMEGQLKILFADEPGGKKKTVDAVKELAGLLDSFAGDVEVSVLEAVGMGKDPAALEAIIKEEHPSIVLVRSDTIAFKDPAFLKMSQENGVHALIRMGVGYDNINDAEAAKLGISVIRTHGSAESVADLSLWFMAALRFMSPDPVFQPVHTDDHQWSDIVATDPVEYYALVEEGKKWKFDPGQEAKSAFAQSVREKTFGLAGAELDSLAQALDGKTIGILGFGAIAKRLIEKLQTVKRAVPGIEFQVLVYSRSLTLDDPRVEGLDVEVVSSREELFQRSNIVSLHIPGNEELKLTEDELKNSSVQAIINTARENLTPAPLMKNFLERGGIYMGDLDLTKTLFELSNRYADQVLVLNHVGASTTSAAEGVEVNTLPTIRHTVEELLEMPASSGFELDIVNQVRPSVVASEVIDEAMSSESDIDVPFFVDPHLRKYGNTDTIRKVLERKINVDEEALARMLEQKTVLVTGAGNVGRALAERLSETGAGQIIVVDNNEPALNNLREYLSTRGKDTGRVKYVIADLRDIKRLERIFSLYGPQIVFHTAAYRLVPRVEENPSEGFKVNVLGTKNLLQVAEKFQVERFVHYSSGKAADFWQSSLYGLTKELTEFVVRAYANRESATRYSIARLTHVIEGSLVIELFKKQIAQDQPVTITHGRMRSKDEVPKVPSINSALLQNVNEAVALGFNAALAGEKAEVFALKNYGNGTAIEVIARELFHDAGKEAQINYIPLREGDIERAGPIPQYPMFKMKDADNEWNNARELNDGVVMTHSNVTVTDALFPLLDGLRQSIDEMTNAQIGERLKTIISNIEKGQFKDWDEVDPRRKIMTRKLNFPLDNLSQRIKGKKVMVMGAGGNIAGAVLDEIFPYEPAEIVLVDNNENTLKDARQRLMLQLKSKGLSTHVVTRLVNLMRFRQVDKLFRDHHPQVIIHTAAHKLQPIIQENPTEPSINNLLTTYNIVLAIRQSPSVEDLVHVSTDKTADPVAIYDLSKKVGELIVQSFLSEHPIRTTIVRFGNVLERSPVIDLFYEQIERGLPITITTPEAIRYFMRRDEAANLILSALSVGGHGDVFVLDMGQDISILQLAKAIIREKGFEPIEGENYEFIGAREGEKFSEGLFSKEEEALGVDRVNDVMRHQLDYPILDKYHMNRLVIEAITLLQENNLDFEFIRGLLLHIIQTNQLRIKTDKAATAEDISVLGDEAMITAGLLATVFSHNRESAIAEVNGLQSEVLIKLLGDLFRLQETERILASSDFRAKGADVTGERRQEAATAARSLEIIPQVIDLISTRLREIGFSDGALKQILERAQNPVRVSAKRSSRRMDRAMAGMSEWDLIMVGHLDTTTAGMVEMLYLNELLERLREERRQLGAWTPADDEARRKLQQDYQKLNIQIEMVEEKFRNLSDQAMSVVRDRNPRASAAAYGTSERLSIIDKLIRNKALITVISVAGGVAVAAVYYLSQNAAHSTDGVFKKLEKAKDKEAKIRLINELEAKKSDSKFIVRNSIAHAFWFTDVMDELETMLIAQGASKEDLAWLYQRMIVGLSEHKDVGAIIEATLKMSQLGYDGLGFLLEWREKFAKLVKNDIADGFPATHAGDLEKFDAAIEFLTMESTRGKRDNAMLGLEPVELVVGTAVLAILTGWVIEQLGEHSRIGWEVREGILIDEIDDFQLKIDRLPADPVTGEQRYRIENPGELSSLIKRASSLAQKDSLSSELLTVLNNLLKRTPATYYPGLQAFPGLSSDEMKEAAADTRREFPPYNELKRLIQRVELKQIAKSRLAAEDAGMTAQEGHSIIRDNNPRASSAEFSTPEQIELMDRAMSADEILTVAIVGAGFAGWLAYLLRSRKTQDWQTLEGLLNHLEADSIRNKIKAADRLGWKLEGSWLANRPVSDVSFRDLNNVRIALWRQYNATENLKFKDALSEALMRIFGSVSSSMPSPEDADGDLASVSGDKNGPAVIFDTDPRATAAEFTSPQRLEQIDKAMTTGEVILLVGGFLAFSAWWNLSGYLTNRAFGNLRNDDREVRKKGAKALFRGMSVQYATDKILKFSLQRKERSVSHGYESSIGYEVTNNEELEEIINLAWFVYVVDGKLDDSLMAKLSSIYELIPRAIYGSDFFVNDYPMGTSSESNPRHTDLEKLLVEIRGDQALITDVGGIDMNEIDVKRGGEGAPIKFEMEGFEPLLNMPIEGFAPVIINVIPITSILPLLGLAPREEEFELSAKLD